MALFSRRWHYFIALLLAPIVLILLLMVAIYLPPVQRWAIGVASQQLEEAMGLKVEVGSVGLTPFLDLQLGEVVAVDAQRDTVLNARAFALDVAFWPLWRGQMDVETLRLEHTQLDSKALIPDVRLRGRVGTLTARSKGVNWRQAVVRLNHLRLADADLDIVLSDTAAPDTAKKPLAWVVAVDEAQLERTAFAVSMPGDTLRTRGQVASAQLRSGHFDLGRQEHRFAAFSSTQTSVEVEATRSPMHLRAAWDKVQLTQANLRLKAPSYRLQSVLLSGGTMAMNQQRAPLPSAPLFSLYDVGLHIDSLIYGRGQQFSAVVRTLGGKERLYRLQIAQATGAVRGDSTGILLPRFRVATPSSQVEARGRLDWAALRPEGRGQLDVRLTSSWQAGELLALARPHLEAVQWHNLQRFAQRYAATKPLGITARLRGNLQQLQLDGLELALFRLARLQASGRLSRPTLPQRKGRIDFQLNAPRLQPFTTLLPPAAQTTVQLPRSVVAKGQVDFEGQLFHTHTTLSLEQGSLAVSGGVDLARETYDLRARVQHFPIAQWLKGYPLSPFSGEIGAKGQGFSPTAIRANLVASAKIDRFAYDRYQLDGLKLDARMRGGNAVVDFSAANRWLSGRGNVMAQVGKTIRARADMQIDRLHLNQLVAMKDTLTLGGRWQLQMATSGGGKTMSASGHLAQLHLLTPRRGMSLRDIDFAFQTRPQQTTAVVDAGDLHLDFNSQGSLPQLSRSAKRLMQVAERQIAQRTIDQAALQRLLPNASLHLRAGSDNPLATIARHLDYHFSSLDLALEGSALAGLNGHLRAGQLATKELVIDTVYGNVDRDERGTHFLLTAHNDKKTNPNPFTAKLKSYLFDRGLGTEVRFADGKGEVGLEMGAQVELAEGGYLLRLYPDAPIVAYRRFQVNEGNYIFLGDDRRIRADVRLLADDGTGLMVRSDDEAGAKNDLSVNVKDLNLGELAKVLPYLPKVAGRLNGDFHLVEDNGTLSAMGTLTAERLTYQGALLGDLGAEVVYMPKTDGEHHADAFVMVGTEEVAQVSGSYFTGEKGRFEGVADLKSFPLALLNGFLDGTEMTLNGAASGHLALAGQPTAPVVNGQLIFDNAHLHSKVYGLDFALEERPVVFANSRLTLSDYRLKAATGDALTLNGDLDFSKPDAMTLDLQMAATNYPLINATRNAESLIYGKVWCDYRGTVRGSLDRLVVRGNLDILSRTNATYLLMNSPLSVKDELSELVIFRDFTDTIVSKTLEEKKGMDMDLSLGVNIQPEAHFNCFLSNNGESYVEVTGDGRLALRMTQQGEMRLTGRLHLNEGKMNYELPVVPLRTFHLVAGSSVEFKGDPMNPTLNIEANDKIKAIVTENDRQRAVTFVAGVRITRSLEDMGLEFTIDAPDDISIKNQLTEMSTEDRGKAAVALLATGMYITDDNLASGGLKVSNAVNAFLQNEIQNIAGKALSTIDISLGMASGTTATGQETTDYNFQFSKRFLNNRMRVIVGGKVSAGQYATNTAESFIDNIALEYRLDQGGSRYVRVFYDRDSQDPLEGSLMKAGAGVVLRRRSDTLGELFLFRRKKTTTSENENQ